MKTVTFDDTKYAIVPIEPTAKQLRDTAFNLCNQYSVAFVEKQEQFARDVYSEMIANAEQPSGGGDA